MMKPFLLINSAVALIACGVLSTGAWNQGQYVVATIGAIEGVILMGLMYVIARVK